MSKSKHLSYWYLVPPILTLLLLLPMILELPPFMPEKIENPNLFQMLITLPFYLGLLAAPGYIYVWLGNYNSQKLGSGHRLWVFASLIIAIVASLVGGLLSVFTVIVAPFAFGSLLTSIMLLLKIRRI